MITLFRRIRQKLIDSGSASKYVLYALGEILLVVIGILIALQVNNWNEKRLNEQELDILYKNALEFYENSSDWLPAIYENVIKEDSLISVLAKGPDPQFLRNNSELFPSIYSNIFSQHEIAPYVFSTTVVNLLDERKVDFPASQQDLIYLLENHQVAVSYTVRSSTDITERTHKLVDWLTDKAPFYFNEDSLSIERKIQLYQDDNIFNYHLSNLKEAYDELLMSIAWSTTTVISLSARLQMIEEPLDAEDMVDLASLFRYTHMENLGCAALQQGSGERFWDVAFQQFIYNASERDVLMQVIDETSMIVNTYTFSPGEMKTPFIPTGHAIRIMQQGECRALYIPGPMQFLVI